MFGIFGLILASGYLVQGVSMISLVLRSFVRVETQTFLWALSVMSLDLVFGTCLAIAAIGLLFRQGWAKKMWLLTLSVVALMHLALAALTQIARGVSTFYLIWTWMIILALGLSWWCLTKSTKVTPQSAAADSPPLPKFD
jgi:hypothetical protein